jgi:hypothetical protein
LGSGREGQQHLAVKVSSLLRVVKYDLCVDWIQLAQDRDLLT